MAEVIAFGELRSTGSLAHKKTIDWIERELRSIPGLRVTSDAYSIERWQPVTPSGKKPNLEHAADLRAGGERIPVAGAVPYARGTSVKGELVYLAPDEALTADHAGKVVLRDFPGKANDFMLAPPLALLAMVNSQHMTSDMYWRMLKRYERPYLADKPLHYELLAAGRLGVAGLLFAFDVPREQIAGYWDPHEGIHYQLPAAFIGVDEAQHLKSLARSGTQSELTVLAERDRADTRNILGILPGQSPEVITMITNTDGNTWVQDNGTVGVLSLARYFASLPLRCRPRTMEFAFNSGHLHMSREGTLRYLQQFSRRNENEIDQPKSAALAVVVEHLGTREIVARQRDLGRPGRELHYSGKAEPLSWAVADQHRPLLAASKEAVERRRLEATVITNGVGLPGDTVPENCVMGGIGTYTHSAMIPTLAVISGPWSLWAPFFGEGAVDFDRMWRQLLAIGDTVLALAPESTETLAGPYPAWREEAGRPGSKPCSLPPFEQAQFAHSVED
ncbi:MAG: hypothetical protein AAGI11_01065 [Pseudomonadota bacterium]